MTKKLFTEIPLVAFANSPSTSVRRRRRSVSVGTVGALSLNSTPSVVVSFSVGDIVGLDVGKGDGWDVGPCDGDSEGRKVGLRYQNRSSGILLYNGFCLLWCY